MLIPENCFISLYKRSLSRFYNMQEKSPSSMSLLQDHDSKKKNCEIYYETIPKT